MPLESSTLSSWASAALRDASSTAPPGERLGSVGENVREALLVAPPSHRFVFERGA
jgi:hypothetical protein